MLVNEAPDVANDELLLLYDNSEKKVHGANMGPTWVLSAPDGPHVGPMNFAIRETAVDFGW